MFGKVDPKTKVAHWSPTPNEIALIKRMLFVGESSEESEFKTLDCQHTQTLPFEEAQVPHAYGLVSCAPLARHGCHGCSPLLGVATLVYSRGQWKVKHVERLVASFGTLGTSKGKITPLGANQFGVIFEAEAEEGEANGSRFIYTGNGLLHQ
jgi:hypothetical protein